MDFYNAILQGNDRLKRYYLEAEHAQTIAELSLENPKPKWSVSSVALKFFRTLQPLRFLARDSRRGENV